MALLGVLHVPQCFISGDAADLSKCNGTVGGVAAEKPFSRLTQSLAEMITSGMPLNTFCYSVMELEVCSAMCHDF